MEEGATVEFSHALSLFGDLQTITLMQKQELSRIEARNLARAFFQTETPEGDDKLFNYAINTCRSVATTFKTCPNEYVIDYIIMLLCPAGIYRTFKKKLKTFM